jgi:hypothetical protein
MLHVRTEMAEPAERLAQLARATREPVGLVVERPTTAELGGRRARLWQLLAAAFGADAAAAAAAAALVALVPNRGALDAPIALSAEGAGAPAARTVTLVAEPLALLAELRFERLIELHSERIACTRLACADDLLQCALAALAIGEVYVAHGAAKPALEHAIRAEAYARHELDREAGGAFVDPRRLALAAGGGGGGWSDAHTALLEAMVMQGRASTRLGHFADAASVLDRAMRAIHFRLGPAHARCRPVLRAQAELALADAADCARAGALLARELELGRGGLEMDAAELAELRAELAAVLLAQAHLLEERATAGAAREAATSPAAPPPRARALARPADGAARAASAGRERRAGAAPPLAKPRPRARGGGGALQLRPPNLSELPPPPPDRAGVAATAARAADPVAAAVRARDEALARVGALRREAAALLEDAAEGADDARRAAAAGARPPAATERRELGAALSAALGHWETAVSAYEALLPQLEAALGLTHARVLRGWAQLARARLHAGDSDGGDAALRHVRAARRAVHGPGSQAELGCTLALADARAQRREWRLAVEVLKAALEESNALDDAQRRAGAATGATAAKPAALTWGYNGPAPEADAVDSGRLLATCLHAYAPTGKAAASHLPLRPGDTVEVLRHDATGAPRLSAPWALGKLRGLTGWFPSEYVRKLPPVGQRSARTERLLEALAGVLVASRDDAELRGEAGAAADGARAAERFDLLFDVERVAVLLDSGVGAAERTGQSPLSEALLGMPTADVLAAAAPELAVAV